MHIDELLKIAADKKASDVHLKSGTHPMMRLHGQLIPIDDDTRLTREDLAEMTSAMMPAKLVEVFERTRKSTSPTAFRGWDASGATSSINAVRSGSSSGSSR